MDKVKTSKDSVSLEELLEWKKLEKPDSDFWNNFENKVRSRTVQSIIEKPSYLELISKIFTSRAVLSYSLPSFVLLVAVTWNFPHLITIANKDVSVVQKHRPIVVAEKNRFINDSMFVEIMSKDTALSIDKQSDFDITSESQNTYQHDFTLNKSLAFSDGISLDGFVSFASAKSKKSNIVDLEF